MQTKLQIRDNHHKDVGSLKRRVLTDKERTADESGKQLLIASCRLHERTGAAEKGQAEQACVFHDEARVSKL